MRPARHAHQRDPQLPAREALRDGPPVLQANRRRQRLARAAIEAPGHVGDAVRSVRDSGGMQLIARDSERERPNDRFHVADRSGEH